MPLIRQKKNIFNKRFEKVTVRKEAVKEITLLKLGNTESLSSMLQTHKEYLNPFYLKGIE